MNTKGKQQSVVLLDEAATLHIPGLDTVPATARENRVATILCFQDLVQGESLYGRIGRDKLLANLANQFYGRVTEPATAERYSRMFGKEEKKYTSTSRSSRSGVSYTTSLREVDKHKPQEFLHLSAGEFYGILSEGRQQTFHVHFKPYVSSGLSIPTIRQVRDIDIRQQFEKIIRDATLLREPG